MVNHMLNKPIGQAVVQHTVALQADVVFDVVADVAFKNGATEFSNPQISETTSELCAGIILAY